MKPELALLVDGDQAGADEVPPRLAELQKAWTVSARVCVRNWRSTKDQASWEAVAKDCNLECIQHSPEGRGNNASDIELAVRAMDLLHGAGYRAFCILSGDSDFLPLKRRLERSGCHVILQPLRRPEAARPAPAAPPPKVAAPPKQSAPAPDAVGFGKELRKAFDKCIAGGRHEHGAVRPVDLGNQLPKDSKPAAFGFPKKWGLLRAVRAVPGFVVERMPDGQEAVRTA